MDELAAAVDELIANLMKDRQAPDPDRLPEVWAAMGELGLTTVGVPEAAGGSGGALSDLVSLAVSLGRYAVSSPLLEHATASWAIAEVGPLPGGVCTIARGPELVDENMAVNEVPWGRHADTMVLLPAESGIYLVDLHHESVMVTPDVNEAGEPRDAVVFARSAVRPLLGAPTAEMISNRLALLWSATLAGAVEGTYRLTREYVNTRHQFGAPLVKIPAVAALLATVKADLVQAEAALSRARQRTATDLEGDAATAAVAAARVISARASTTAARLSHQLHGAMGITAEYPLYLHTTRLWAWRDEAGTEVWWARLLGERAQRLGETDLWTVLTS
ncbi:acyl-CoA dehydrogenase family protein [Nocardioides sp. NPDC051685]|uniref:acyl-CoA dehydrogenase family protein n=1 Tax=Nocardioides sp. NPDC051685 TaxID=3364334 RepID=UPI0037970BBA